MVKMKSGKWVPIVLAIFLFELVCRSSYASYSPADNYLISCGSSQNVTYLGRTFLPDSAQSSRVLKSANSVVASSNSSVPSPVYQSARIFSATSSYKFEIEQKGRHWVRLYFYPLSNSGNNLNSASFTVATDQFVLLSNFTFKNYNGSSMFKEYAINVTSDTFTLYFVPSNNSVAFVNAIEVVSIPDALFPDQALALHPSAPFSGLSDLGFETIYRLNIGGPWISAQNDTLGRTWENDEKYLHVDGSAVRVSVSPSSIQYPASVTSETAPNWVYATAVAMGDANVAGTNYNITWVFPVDPNFRYFVRVHFCDIVSDSLNNLVFNLYINDYIALGSVDLSSLTNGLNVPYYKDFVSNSSTDSHTLNVSVGPDIVADITNATMNGLEIMKISNEAKSLDGLSSVEGLLPKKPSNNNKLRIIIGSVGGAVAALVLVVVCYCCLVARKSKTPHQGHPWLPLPLVYKGTLEEGTKVAVKRGNPRSEQGLAEFRTEIEMLSKLRHRHLVSLIGYCDERSEMILGSFGYLDPEYFRRQQLTEKSDVYSFGVVLMEVLCTRPALNPVLPREQVNIAEWAMTWQKKGMLDQIMDPNLVGKVNLASLKKFGETAEKCLAEHGVDRPSMGDVLWNLEYAFQLEETSSALMEPEDNSTNHIPGIQLTPLEPFDNSVSMIDGGNSRADDDGEDVATSAVFSQLVNPRGR
ncbi:hypothetical protein Patl1_04564 [Pistacia atlantica]|uniref:Uncharacterized protein n=1 Tax=Pistacia atlantica TaxID=434234 RepID=A0ACC1BWR1_9ROSI|nr:hypothetical protein Patl1_04564 [Pistacia atlantica]